MAESTSVPLVPQAVQETTELVRSSLATAGAARPEVGLATETKIPEVPTFTWGGYWHGIGIMFLLLAVLWFLARTIKRFGRFNFIPRQGTLPKDAFFTEAQMPLGPRKYLVVVRFLNKRLLLGVTDQQIVLLTQERVHDGDAADFDAYIEESKQTE